MRVSIQPSPWYQSVLCISVPRTEHLVELCCSPSTQTPRVSGVNTTSLYCVYLCHEPCILLNYIPAPQPKPRGSVESILPVCIVYICATNRAPCWIMLQPLNPNPEGQWSQYYQSVLCISVPRTEHLVELCCSPSTQTPRVSGVNTTSLYCVYLCHEPCTLLNYIPAPQPKPRGSVESILPVCIVYICATNRAPCWIMLQPLNPNPEGQWSQYFQSVLCISVPRTEHLVELCCSPSTQTPRVSGVNTTSLYCVYLCHEPCTLLNYIPAPQPKPRGSVESILPVCIVYICATNRASCWIIFQPLNPNPEGQWSQYFRDNDMLVQIDKDCRWVDSHDLLEWTS